MERFSDKVSYAATWSSTHMNDADLGKDSSVKTTTKIDAPVLKKPFIMCGCGGSKALWSYKIIGVDVNVDKEVEKKGFKSRTKVWAVVNALKDNGVKVVLEDRDVDTGANC